MTLFSDGDVAWLVELGLSGEEYATDVWDTALWDTAIWSGYAPSYIDVTPWTLGLNFRYGADRFNQRMQTGRAYVTFDNQKGVFNPNFGAEDLPGGLDLRPGRWLRISAVATVNGMDTTYRLFEGVVDTLDERYLAGASDSVTVVTVYDFAATMALDDPPALLSPVGAGESTSQRVTRILDEFGPVDGGWIWRDISNGDHSMQASTLAQNRLEETQRAAEAEGGVFFFQNRVATFRPFQWLTGRSGEFPRSTDVQMWPGRGFPGDPDLLDADAEWTMQVLYNDIQLARTGGSAIRVQNTQSQTLYGSRTFRRLNYENDQDSQVADLANRLLAVSEWDYQRLRSLIVFAADGVAASSVFRTELGDLVQASVPLTLRGWGYTVQAHVLGIGYAVTADDWSCTLRIDQAFRQAPGDLAAFDDGYSDGWL